MTVTESALGLFVLYDCPYVSYLAISDIHKLSQGKNTALNY